MGIATLIAGTVGLFGASCGGSSTSQPPATQSQGVQSNKVVESTEKPVVGGTIKYGLEAESDGFDPTSNRWAISGVMVGLAVYDPLAAYNDKGEAKPYLAESFTANATYTEWTIKLRPNIKFSNGVPLTSAAVMTTLQTHLKSILTKPVFSAIDPTDPNSITTPDPLTVVIKLKSPWVVFPSTLTAQTGVIPEPSTLVKDAAGDIPAVQLPIGTGPFTQTAWKKDNAWQGAKNKTYWRKDKDGTQLPYLDNIEFRPIKSYESRSQSLEAGTIQMMHTNEAKAIQKFRDLSKSGAFQIVEDNGEGEEGLVIMNNAKPPFDDVNARKALAFATDTVEYGASTSEGLLEAADGPFRKNSAWHSDFKNYPKYDMVEAKRLVGAYKAAHGGQAPTFEYGITEDSQPRAAFLQASWNEAGFVVTVQNFDQATFISNAVQGKYQANQWRQFGAPDPDADLLWWSSANAGDGPEGGLTLNIARHKSPCVDAALKSGRETPDLTARKKAYADLQQCFADEVPYVWLDHSVWTVVAAKNVRGITNGPLPDGSASLAIGGAGDFGGVTRLTQTWLAPA